MDIVYLYKTYLNDPEILFWFIFIAGTLLIFYSYDKEITELDNRGDDYDEW